MKTPNQKLSPSFSGPEAGVSLRDYFATIALAELITSRPQDTAEKKALDAYQIADSMMRQRERTMSGLKS